MQSVNRHGHRSGKPEECHLRRVLSGLGLKPSTIQLDVSARMIDLASILSLPHICVDDTLYHFLGEVLKLQVVAEVSSP